MSLTAFAIRAGDFWPEGQWVQSKTPRGRECLRWIWIGMPKLPPQLLHATFYLFETVEDAESGDGYGGTGFLIGRVCEAGPEYCTIYAVSNFHVACQKHPVIRINKKDGGTHVIDLIADQWVFDPTGHDIDIVPMPAMCNKTYEFAFVATETLATDEIIRQHEIGPGEDVFMIGRFLNADGAEINRPAVRFGNISLMPIPMKQECNGLTKPSYCIDLHSRDGFSGSPVFVYRKPGQDLSTGNLNMGDQFLYLLGIHWAQFPEAWEIVSKPKGAETETIGEASVEGDDKLVMGLSGMTCVAPASAILALLEHPKLRAQHDKNNVAVKSMKAQEKLLGEANLEFTGPTFSVEPSDAVLPALNLPEKP